VAYLISRVLTQASKSMVVERIQPLAALLTKPAEKASGITPLRATDVLWQRRVALSIESLIKSVITRIHRCCSQSIYVGR
jgi:hypothetical protein